MKLIQENENRFNIIPLQITWKIKKLILGHLGIAHNGMFSVSQLSKFSHSSKHHWIHNKVITVISFRSKLWQFKQLLKMNASL